jgi:hypothetical protein
MVADKSKSEINVISQLECGDSNKIISNLNVSSTKSLKIFTVSLSINKRILLS